jgi:eukaryotic-like serine/threonine-protein kinase
MALAAGSRLGPYEIVAPLGAGGMGEVYRARDTRLGRTVAVKVLLSSQAPSPQQRQRFEREARAISSFSHPHICSLFDVGQHDGTDYLVMEHLEGETLAQRLAHGPLATDQVLSIGIQIADALGHAHEHRLVHRDLKPANVMITRSGAKLLDFGLAQSLPGTSLHSSHATATKGTTEAGAVVGTFPYMSPEQLQGRDADPRSDIFALGAVLYEMTTGKRAFPGETQISVASAILDKQPEAVGSLRPPGLDRLVRACLEKDPDARWQNARDLKRQLEWVREGAGLAEARPRAATKAWPFAAAAALVLLLGLLAWAVRSGRSQERMLAYRASLLPPSGVFFAPHQFALSADGARLAFIGVGADGQGSLWVRSLDARASQELRETRDSEAPFWAPDSRRLGFFADGKLKVVDTRNGAVQVLADAPSGRGGTWHRNGTIVFAPNSTGPLASVSENGGPPKLVTSVERESGKAHRWPTFLPDGRRFLYFQDWGKPEGSRPNGIYVGSLDGGEPRLVSSDISGNVSFASGHLLYVKDGSLMARPYDTTRLEPSGPEITVVGRELATDVAFSQTSVSVSESGVVAFQSLWDAATELIWYDRGGREVGRIPQAGLRDPKLSPDGRLLVATSNEGRDGRTFIRVLDLERSVSTTITNEGHEVFPTWSPDGSKVAYVTRSGPKYAMAQTPADGSGQAEVLLEGSNMVVNGYTPDGRGLLFMRLDRPFAQLALLDVAERRSRDLFLGAEAQVSPSGDWVACLLPPQLEGSGPQLTLLPLSGPLARVPVAQKSSQPRFSRDGKRLFFIASDRKLMEVELGVREGRLVPGVPHPLFQTHIMSPNFVLFQYDVNNDGSRFLVNSLKPEAPLTLITDWTRALRK